MAAIGWGALDASSPVLVGIGVVGSVAALGLFLSPVETFRRIVKEKSVADFDHVPYVIAWMNCALWTSYAVLTPGRLEPLVTNAAGGVLQMCWIATFLRFAAPEPRARCVRAVLAAVLCVLAVDGLALAFATEIRFPKLPGDSRPASIIGIVAAFLNVAMYAAPLNVVRLVARTKSVEFMPLGLTVGTLACSVAWTAYALLVADLSILVPNLCGDVLGVVQCLIYAKYATAPAPKDPVPGEDLAEGLLQ